MPSNGRPLSNITCGARGLSASVTDAGPPEKITPLGWSRSNASSAGIERRDLAIDARLAHAPRDQLGHLAAEVDDEDGLGGLDRHGGPIGRRRSKYNAPDPALEPGAFSFQT